ncbi:long-chain fatty acid transport protein 6 isoform X1 [Hypomesus transpacificus]|uniref:long-chain fatty acid transport protein 6 isoform X1 n=1 Tax=Hypomesus transpacificus TaxID=137520 RepID=UPI001F086F1F|nr:long-chain fatty acid transport protein 6 isoform X1 [Hypomesus transpacificus]
MITWILSTFSAGVFSLLIYQRMFYRFFWDDLIYYLKLRMVGKALMSRMQRGVFTYVDCFLNQAKKTSDKPFVVFENQTLTYQDVDKRSNQFATVLKTVGNLKQGDIVALLMSNEPDFICVWFGLSKLGCEVAFLNFNIKTKSLLHCIEICGAKSLVVGADLVSSLDNILPTLEENNIKVWVSDASSPHPSVNTLLDKVEQASSDPLLNRPKVDLMSNFLFIFTSGTTGLPKAARVGHLKAAMSMSFLRLCGARSDDNIYIPLPLYHMTASLLGIGGCIELGATCVLKKKFSASHFWKDCVKHNITVFQYIGELCRYLVNQPVVPEERTHDVRVAAGSGLRPDVWKEFARRFGKINIREAYGLTEASIGFVNYTSEIGPIGRASYFNKLNMPFELLKFNPQLFEPTRTNTGRCTKANKGETGILVAPVSALNPFLGYAGNELQSEKKLLRDVFREGDMYFNTGDLMLQDHRDFVYFRDRIGDTFRWKGENVATTEVSEILGSLEFLQEVNVYGVSVPGYEGRAGMAALVLKPDQDLDGKKIYSLLVQSLPPYSWPWFLRIQMAIDVTETFKQQKGKLVREGFSPEAVHEPLYFLDLLQKDYICLTPALYNDIISGKIRI